MKNVIMSKAKPCTWNGTLYPSQGACARALGVSAQRLYYWLKQGYTSDEEVRQARIYKKPCKWNGITYPSIKACAKANNITYSGMAWRIRNNHDCDDDLRY